VPTPEQLRSTAHLLAWLMQEYNVPLAQVKGHRDVWVGATSCPGETWKNGVRWHDRLAEEIQAVAQGNPERRIEHYLLFWDHGADWAKTDWAASQRYIARFRPTTGFSTDDALLAKHVTIVGGYAGVSGEDEARLRAAGADVHRLNGANEAETLALLDALVTAGTPWPGASPQSARSVMPTSLAQEQVSEAPILDEWSIPDGALTPSGEPIIRPGESVRIKVQVPPPTGPVGQ
jgi:hypothetical protein